MIKLKSSPETVGAVHTHTHIYILYKHYGKEGGSLFITSSKNGAKEEVESN